MPLYIPLPAGRGRRKATKTKDAEEFGAPGRSYGNFAQKFVLTRRNPASGLSLHTGMKIDWSQ